ncbi:MAG TPA: sigma-70 family RNA polymerase sigma factor [Saprospiraceae bacterium]|nr:sigma-70 family RNA polymerase sigma factor [Saprospiraceae bacterium]
MTEETKHWQSIKEGDIASLQALYDHYVDSMYSYGMTLCHDEDKVKDCIHDLFLYLWEGRKNFAIPASGKAYLFVSLRRRIFDKGSKLQSMTGSLDQITEADFLSKGHEEHWIKLEEDSLQQQKLDSALARISERQREIIHMKYYQQLEYEEIAQIMELNYQSARNLVNRALIALRKEMLLIVMLLLMFT